MQQTLLIDPDLGRVDVPEALKRYISLPGGPTRKAHGEVGIFIAKWKRPQYRCGQASYAHDYRLCGDPDCLVRMELMGASISHNERVDAGAAAQDALVFGSGTTRFTTVAVANATMTKAQTDKSLDSVTQSVTTHEFTTLGLSRAAGSLGAYTAPASLGGTFSRVITKTFTASGGATAKGAGLFDSVTVSGSTLYVEDNFSSDAVLVTNDTLTVNATITN